LLVLTRRPDESIVIGDDIIIKVISMEDGKVKLGISAPRDVSIHRLEVYQSIQQQNMEAALSREVSIKDLDNLLKAKKDKKD
jgi:carbon storage regulator